MKLLLLTAALVHCASAMNSNSGKIGDCNSTLECPGHEKDNACSECGASPWRPVYRDARDRFPGLGHSKLAAERLAKEADEQKSASGSAAPLDAEEDSMLTLLPRKEWCSECSEEMKQDATQPKEKETLTRALDCETCKGKGFIPLETGPKVSKQLICSMSKYVKGLAEGDNTLDCTKCGKTVAPEQADADQCSECGNEGEGWKAQIVALARVDAKTLEYIIEYLKILKGFSPEQIVRKHDEGRITKPIRDTNILKCVHEDDIAEGKWIEGIFNKHRKRAIFDIILAANYMGMKPLLHLGCCKIATLIKGKTAEQIKEILSLESVPVLTEENGLAAAVNSFADVESRRRLLKKLLGM